MDIAFICLSLLGYCFVLTRFTDLPIESTFLLVLSSAISYLYIIAYFNFLWIGAWLLIIIGAIALLMSFVIFIRNKQELFTKYITPGLVIMITYVVIYSLLSLRLRFHIWDEFTHWGAHAKFVWMNHGFILKKDFTLHPSYPPGSALFYFIFYLFRGFSEPISYVAQQLLILTAIPIFIQRIAWRNGFIAFIGYTLCVLVLQQHLGISLGKDGTLDMDFVVGIFVGYAIVFYRLSSRKTVDILRIIPLMTALILFKVKLMPFVLLVFSIIFFDQLINAIFFIQNQSDSSFFSRLKKSVQSHYIHLVTRIIAIVLLPISAWLFNASWYHYVHTIGVKSGWVLKFPPFRIWHLLLGYKLLPYEALIRTTFIHTEVIHYGLLVSAFILLVLLTFILTKNKQRKQAILFDNAFMLLGFFAYSFGLLLMYLYCYNTYMGSQLTQFYRFMGIYFVIWWMVVFNGCFTTILDYRLLFKKSFQILLTTILIILSILPIIFSHSKFYSHPFTNRLTTGLQMRHSIQKITDKLKKVTGKHDNIFFIWQSKPIFPVVIMFYELLPRAFNPNCIHIGNPISTHDYYACNFSNAQLLLVFKKINYILLAYTNKDFWNRYGKTFPKQPPQLKPFAQYTICEGKYSVGTLVSHNLCKLTQENAYLFKVIHKNGKIILKNIVYHKK